MEGVETLDGRKKRLNAIRYRGWRRGREREREGGRRKRNIIRLARNRARTRVDGIIMLFVT